MQSGWVTSGPKVAEFEAELSRYFGGRPVRCFANGTATMKIALQIAGIGTGDEVIVDRVARGQVYFVLEAPDLGESPLTREVRDHLSFRPLV